jgi:hypothetical protein
VSAPSVYVSDPEPTCAELNFNSFELRSD